MEKRERRHYYTCEEDHHMMISIRSKQQKISESGLYKNIWLYKINFIFHIVFQKNRLELNRQWISQIQFPSNWHIPCLVNYFQRMLIILISKVQRFQYKNTFKRSTVKLPTLFQLRTIHFHFFFSINNALWC